ncbi:MAG TPA: hypothetical protein VKP69_13030, partial [Isosphaeraceae bacterium]|nr:hypothetical protein [Isosphaeraceae bacterium]
MATQEIPEVRCSTRSVRRPSIVMEIEEVAIEIGNRELPEAPWLSLEGFNDVRASGFQFIVRRVEVL